MRDAHPTRRGRARPVADAPVAALVADAGELARDWLLALVASAPLDDVGRVPAGELAARAPALCVAMAHALADDDAFDALASGDLAPTAGRLAGAADAAGTAAAIEALRGVLWTAAIGAVQRPEPALVAALADRLAAVAAAVTAAALAHEPERRAPWPPDAARPEPEPSPVFALAPSPPAAPDVRARDLRPRIGDGDHMELLERCVSAHLADQRTLAVLLVELDGVDRLLAADLAGEAADAVRRAEHAVETLLRPGDGARRESTGRIWVALAGTGPAGARALALRVAAAVEREADHRGTPLTASVGVAVFPVDATDAHALAERAEDALFTARASGSRGAPPPSLR